MKHSNTASHPTSAVGKTALVIVMFGIVVLFAALGARFMRIPIPDEQFFFPISVPDIFILNALILAAISWLLHSAWRTYPQTLSKNKLSAAMILGVGFLLSQSYAWYVLSQFPQLGYSHVKIQYMYLLSGLHAVHISGALGLLLFVMAKYDHLKGQRYLELAVYFWHFLGILWLYLLGVLWVGL